MIEVWSKPIRIFHSLLIMLIITAFLTEDFKKIHEVVGYMILSLIIFRIIYGLITKNIYEKLSSFFFSPKEILLFIKSVLQLNEKRYLGHNPLAGLVMIGIILTIIGMAISGGVGFAMKEEEGFLAMLVTPNFELGKTLLNLHELLSHILLILIGSHLMGVLVSSILTKENYLRAIFRDGKKKEER